MRETDHEVTNIEIYLLVEAILKRYGYDFHNYGKAHIKRRILHFMKQEKIAFIAELQRLILYNQDVFHRLLLNFSVNVTEMFRDPLFYNSYKENVIPRLETYPYLKFWHAGCSTGEEVYSNVIMLKELGLYEKSQLYATDFNQIVLQKAEGGIYPLQYMKDYIKNYRKAGLTGEFSSYYTANDESLIFKKELKEQVLFSSHNLVTDGVFGEMNVILCRNVLIYFDRKLQNKVFRLFHESLVHGGYLCLGSKESLEFSEVQDAFDVVDPKMKIYRKVK